MDLPPDESSELNDQLGVGGDDYFGAIVREPAADELEGLSRRLRRLIRIGP
jgi:hypothetical protein